MEDLDDSGIDNSPPDQHEDFDDNMDGDEPMDDDNDSDYGGDFRQPKQRVRGGFRYVLHYVYFSLLYRQLFLIVC